MARCFICGAVDHEGEIIESDVMKTRDKSVALAFMKKTLKLHHRGEAIVTDGLRSYPATIRELGNIERHEMGRWDGNRDEELNSHDHRVSHALWIDDWCKSNVKLVGN